MRDSLASQWLNMLKREDFKKEIKMVLQPLIDLIIQEINPYLYAIISFIAVSFLLILSILIAVMCLIRRQADRIM